ncbi:rod shape-determining protein MreC [Saltatorellus ferox]
MRGRSLGAFIGFGAALFALRPVGPVERVLGLVLLPVRVVAPLGTLSTPFAGTFDEPLDPETLAQEAVLSLQLERAVLRSAWPQHSTIPAGVVAIPGEVDARQGTKRDHIMVRVRDDASIRLDHPVVAGDVYVGRVERIPHRQPAPDNPGTFTRWMRRLKLASPPVRPPRNVVEVALITGASERVGGVVPKDQDGRSCRLVAGGLSPRNDRTWLAVHNPESRATRSGSVVVQEPFSRVNGFDSLAEGFLIGELKEEPYQREGESFQRPIIGIQPPVDFASGLNQVLVLTDGAAPTSGTAATSAATRAQREAAGATAVPVLESARWLSVRLFAYGDTAPWRSTARLHLGSRSGVRAGAAVVSGVRLAGRIARCDEAGSTVALVDDPGFEVDVLAQAISDPDSEPLVLGRIRSVGRARNVIRFEWRPEGGSLHGEWSARHADDDGVDVRLWTGSGLVATPRGLLLGTTRLPLELPPEESVYLDLVETGSVGEELFVHAGARERDLDSRGEGER